MLNERGIKAVTPSALNTPAGANFSPTVTPCNSPEGSPTRDRSPEPSLTGLLYSGADMIRRKLVGENPIERTSRLPARNKILLSRQEKRALRSLRLVEKVESIGLDNIIHSSSSSTSSSHHAVGISPLALSSRSRNASPMTQLTSLKNISHSRRSDDMYAVDRETIQAVLNKGFSHDSLDDDITTDGSTTSSITSRSGHSTDTTLERDKVNTSTTPEATRTPVKTDARVKQMQRQKSRRSLLNSGGGQRPDLGTVAGGTRTDGGRMNKKLASTKQMQQSIDGDDDDQLSVASEAPHQTIAQSFVGSISSLFFGRKGGLL